jgi:hypothetical protein
MTTGFTLEALGALYARVQSAAHILDPGFPTLPPYVEVDVDTSTPGELTRRYRGERDGRAIMMWVVEEVQDGIGGPIGTPRTAGFAVTGLATGELRGRWNGTAHTDTVIVGPADRVEAAQRHLAG